MIATGATIASLRVGHEHRLLCIANLDFVAVKVVARIGDGRSLLIERRERSGLEINIVDFVSLKVV